jgi:hypothetical protein
MWKKNGVNIFRRERIPVPSTVFGAQSTGGYSLTVSIGESFGVFHEMHSTTT